MALAAVQSFGATERRDAWWLQPVAVALGLGVFVVYSTWAAFQNAHYLWGPYLSPFYSPLFFQEARPGFWPGFLPFSPALLILWAPGGFRVTCYYYRKAYYRAYFMDPPACAVGEFRGHGYRGETSLPFILQNLHRYFLYLALVFIVILWADVFHAFFFDGRFGIGLGTVVLFLNTLFLSLYTFSCHSLRHLAGGYLDCFSSCALAKARHGIWSGLSRLNEHHMLWAWMSLFSVGFADFYVRMVSMGVFSDFRFF